MLFSEITGGITEEIKRQQVYYGRVSKYANKPDPNERGKACKEGLGYAYARWIDREPRPDTRKAACAEGCGFLYALHVDRFPDDATRAAAIAEGKGFEYALYVDHRPREDTLAAAIAEGKEAKFKDLLGVSPPKRSDCRPLEQREYMRVGDEVNILGPVPFTLWAPQILQTVQSNPGILQRDVVTAISEANKDLVLKGWYSWAMVKNEFERLRRMGYIKGRKVATRFKLTESGRCYLGDHAPSGGNPVFVKFLSIIDSSTENDGPFYRHVGRSQKTKCIIKELTRAGYIELQYLTTRYTITPKGIVTLEAGVNKDEVNQSSFHQNGFVYVPHSAVEMRCQILERIKEVPGINSKELILYVHDLNQYRKSSSTHAWSSVKNFLCRLARRGLIDSDKGGGNRQAARYYLSEPGKVQLERLKSVRGLNSFSKLRNSSQNTCNAQP